MGFPQVLLPDFMRNFNAALSILFHQLFHLNSEGNSGPSQRQNGRKRGRIHNLWKSGAGKPTVAARTTICGGGRAWCTQFVARGTIFRRGDGGWSSRTPSVARYARFALGPPQTPAEAGVYRSLARFAGDRSERPENGDRSAHERTAWDAVTSAAEQLLCVPFADVGSLTKGIVGSALVRQEAARCSVTRTPKAACRTGVSAIDAGATISSICWPC